MMTFTASTINAFIASIEIDTRHRAVYDSACKVLGVCLIAFELVKHGQREQANTQFTLVRARHELTLPLTITSAFSYITRARSSTAQPSKRIHSPSLPGPSS